MKRFRLFFRHISPFQAITRSFLAVILLGSLLLYLPVSAAGAGRSSFLDALFTASSAVCVTGLVVHNTATFWSPFGKRVILLPAIFFFFFEFTDGSLTGRLLQSFFQSVTTRTAGFNTMPIDRMHEGSLLIMIALMLVGGSPGSTAGGMKTTTLAIIVVASGCYIRQKKSYSVFGRSVSSQVVLEAFTLLMLYLTLFFTGSLIISCVEGLPILDCMFECASALGTVGLTTGITPTLGSVSKIILIVFMYFGRVGGLTLAYAALAGGKADTGKFPEEKVMVG